MLRNFQSQILWHPAGSYKTFHYIFQGSLVGKKIVVLVNKACLSAYVKDCIFVNCCKSGQAINGMNGGQGGKNPVWTITGNVFNFDDADTSADESTGDDDEPVKDSKAVVVKFADAANGDFTQAEAEAGDPRWIK